MVLSISCSVFTNRNLVFFVFFASKIHEISGFPLDFDHWKKTVMLFCDGNGNRLGCNGNYRSSCLEILFLVGMNDGPYYQVIGFCCWCCSHFGWVSSKIIRHRRKEMLWSISCLSCITFRQNVSNYNSSPHISPHHASNAERVGGGLVLPLFCFSLMPLTSLCLCLLPLSMFLLLCCSPHFSACHCLYHTSTPIIIHTSP